MRVALTFDDGPGPSTEDLLRVLKDHECIACFFLLGENIPARREVVIQLLREGHLAGNHTMTHKSGISLQALRTEIEECDGLLETLYDESQTSAPRPIPFRLPYGIRTFIADRTENGVRKPAAALDNRLQVLAGMGRTHVHWTAILRDWEAKSSSDAARLAEIAIEHVQHMESEGLDAVLAMHDGSEPDQVGRVASREFTVEAADLILKEVRKKGWTTFRAPIA